jgi:hypothetical protein
MNVASLRANDPYSLFRMGEAWRNRRGLLTLVATFLVSALFGGLAFSTHVTPLALLLQLMALFIYFIGISAAGVQFMEQANGRPISSTLDALASSPMLVLRALGLALIFTFSFVAYFIVAGLLLLLCKIPGIGGALYAVILPALTLLGAFVYFAMFVVVLLSGVALWEGHTLKASLSRLWAVLTQRPMEAFLNLAVLFVVIGLVGGLIGMFLFFGFVLTGGMSAAILSGGGDIASMMQGDFSSTASMLRGGMAGGAILFAIYFTFMSAMGMLGLALVYLKVTDGIDVAAAESAMEAAAAKARDKMQAAAEDARRRAQEAQAAAQARMQPAAPPVMQQPAVMPQAPAAAMALACPGCRHAIGPGDVFCGNCGFKLK